MYQVPVALECGVPLTAENARILCIPKDGDPSPCDVVGYVGGSAMLPVGTQMPTVAGTYLVEGEVETLSHLATFSTSVLCHVAPELPAGNLVLLFATTDQPWSYVSHTMTGERSAIAPMTGMQDGHRVAFVPFGAETVAVEGGTTFPRRDLVAVDGQIVDIPDESDFDRVPESEYDRYDEICDAAREFSFGAYHEAINVQGPIENVQQEVLPLLPELGEVVRGIHGTAPEDWVCIAQVQTLGCYHEPKVEGSYSFGDSGTLYFCILRADLSALRFDRTVCLLQCG
jgi:hypothetical protein